MTAPPFQYSQITAGISTGPAPTCARQSMNMTAVSSDAPGTPAMNRPTPPRAAWTTAVTTTPSATPRAAFPARTATASPLDPARRRAKPMTPHLTVSPFAYMIAAMIVVSRNCRSVMPMPPAWSTNHCRTRPE